jgi:glycosyltransferase involved in cell wall biosynthesis
VTHAGGNPEIVIQNETGFVTPNDDEQAFADAMITLAQNKPLQEAFGRASKERFINTFGINNMTLEYERLYLRLLSGSQE